MYTSSSIALSWHFLRIIVAFISFSEASCAPLARPSRLGGGYCSTILSPFISYAQSRPLSSSPTSTNLTLYFDFKAEHHALAKHAIFDLINFIATLVELTSEEMMSKIKRYICIPKPSIGIWMNKILINFHSASIVIVVTSSQFITCWNVIFIIIANGFFCHRCKHESA